MTPPETELIASDALRANLLETAQKVTVPPEYQLLLDVVSKYRGIHNNLETLLLEICHPFRNWALILPQLRSYLLKNGHLYTKHPQAPDAFKLFSQLFWEALMESKKNDPVLAHTVEALFAWLDKMISVLTPDGLKAYEAVLNGFFSQIHGLSGDKYAGDNEKRPPSLDDSEQIIADQTPFSSPRSITGEGESAKKRVDTDENSRAMVHIVQGHHALRKMVNRITTLGQRIPQTGGTAPYDFAPLSELMGAVLRQTYYYWLDEEDPRIWLKKQGILHGTRDQEDALLGDVPLKGMDEVIALVDAVSHRAVKTYLDDLAGIMSEGMRETGKMGANALKAMSELPTHLDMVRQYKAIPKALNDCISEAEKMGNAGQAGNSSQAGKTGQVDEVGGLPRQAVENLKLRFLFKIMDIPGLALIHEETLREINQSLVKLIRRQGFEEIESFLLTTFKFLEANVKRYPHTSLNCIQVLGDEVFKRGNSRMVETFLWEAVRFGFQQASVEGVDEEWQPITNPAHLTNIRVWLHLITQEPKWCATLFSALIINIKLAGTCVKDTDLFQRDITHLLNHPIEPVYNLVKQFAKLMPVFFNQIGAEGELRYVSTELDEVHKRKDRLIHFLRKQAHVESSNLVVAFMGEIFTFWCTRDKTPLANYVPHETYDEIDCHGPYIDGLHRLTLDVERDLKIVSINDTLTLGRKALKQYLNSRKSIPRDERRRFDLMVQMYRLVHQKYNLSFQDLKSEFAQAERDGFSGMMDLMKILENDQERHANDTGKIGSNDRVGHHECSGTATCLDALLIQLERLKGIILSEETFTAREAIHHKRHIAVDIPSMYGSYQEKKFDSLSLTFRLENLAALYLERLPDAVNLSFITQATFFHIADCLKLYLKALAIDGITSRRLNTYMSLLESSLTMRRFSYTQYMDIFRGFSEGVKDVIYAYYTNIHQNNLSIILPRIGKENLIPRYRGAWQDDDPSATLHRLSEAFFRDLIASTFGLQHLDLFITRILQTLERQKSLLSEDLQDLLMTYNPEKSIAMLDDCNPMTHNPIHLSNKGFNLVTLREDDLPVPPAFIITTEIFRCREVVYSFSRAKEAFMGRIRDALNRIEGLTGKRFGFPMEGASEKPLLLSVRSGSALSMPGMMATIHNVGLNEELIGEYLTHHGNSYLIWDNYRRFIQSWAMISGKVVRDEFQQLMDEAKARHGVALKWEFTPDQMQGLALSYQRLVRSKGIGIPDDPWLQLVGAIEMVLDSWQNIKAVDYRRVMDLSDAWGTAVIVQSMVYGNKSRHSGSGVLFTSHPYRKVQRVALWGDYAYGDQGEDIVSGLVASHPISVEQGELDGRDVEKSLEIRFPEIYNRLLTIARELVYQKRWNPQEIEFTFEGPEPEDLYLLQTRDMITIKKKEQFDVFLESPALSQSYLGNGIGVSGSALAGMAVFSEAQIQEMRERFASGREARVPLILIRQDTVPEDIKVIDMADGLLTSRGGQTSHASVVAVRLEKTCVVGCRKMKVYESRHICEFGSIRIGFGDAVSIDGRNGRVFQGMHPHKTENHILPM